MKHIFLIFLVLLVSPSLANAQDQIYIKVGEANVKKSLLALPPFQYQGSPVAAPNFKSVGTDIFNTVSGDLDVSGYFQFVRQDAYLEDTATTGLLPAPGLPNGFNYENWRKIGTEFLVRAGFTILRDTVTVETYVYHVPQAKVVLSKKYNSSTRDTRKLAHTIANDIIFKLTGKPGIFLSKIVTTSDRAGRGWKEVFVMDWDATNPIQVSSHKSIALSPSWSPDGKTVVYTAFALHQRAKVRNADLFAYELDTGKRLLLSQRKGINSGGTYTPDGRHIFLTLSMGGTPDIYRMNTDGESLVQITRGPSGAMNVEPTISPDGSKIAFSSDRSGRPMIYIANTDGSGVKRLTFAGVYNSSPAFSPDGKKLAFAGYDKDHFDIFVMNLDGTGLERLTESKRATGKWANNEEPTFSPDGRQIMFTSDRTGSNQIYIVNVDGTGERRITIDRHNYYKPKWHL